MKLLFLGTASAIPGKDRDNTSIAFDLNGEIFLVDCPGSVVQKLLKANWNPLKIKNVLISHAHTDHVYGLPSLIHVLWLMGKKDEMKIYTPSAHVESIRELINSLGLFEKEGMFPIVIEGIPLEDKQIFKVKGFSITTFPVKHPLPNVGVVVTFENRKVVYSSDTEPCDNVLKHAKGADILIHESNESLYITGGREGHSTARDAGRMAKESNVKTLYLVHLGPSLFDRIDDVIKEAKEVFEGEVIIPQDLEEVLL